jgi:hypothetical protein
VSDDTLLLAVVGVPVAAVCVAAFALHFISSAWIVRISSVAIGIQVAATVVAFVLPATMSKETRADGQLCPNDEGVLGNAEIAVALGSIAVGAIALASSVIAVHRGAATKGRLAAGIGAAALVVPIFASIIITAFCGYE